MPGGSLLSLHQIIFSMARIYLDNAATTAMRPEVVQEMTKVMMEDFGNPSSTHSIGRHAKSLVELSRKTIAKHLNCTAQEIIFTSNGTEANNIVLQSAVKNLGVKRIITSKIEHHAVLYVIQALQEQYNIQVDFVNIKSNGTIDITHLSELLSDDKKTLVSLMHINNEIGTVLDLERVTMICKQYNVLFHTDAVQSVGKIKIDLEKMPVDFLSSSAHKFHGPKGVGFAFVRKNSGLQPLIYGGEQEKGLRPGTEATHQIVGMAKALDISYQNFETESTHILNLQNYLKSQLEIEFTGFKINGENSFYNILNVQLPIAEDKTAMMLFALDMKGIEVSRGSACQSGSNRPSHVLAEILSAEDLKKPSLRISLSHQNTIEDIDYLIESLKSL